jgi:heat shock protein HslJ
VALATAVGTLALLTGCGGGGTGSPPIVGVLWEWTGGQDAHPPSLHAVPDPESYLLVLNPDGSLQAQADCNQIHGTYTLSGHTLTLSLGAATLAACGPHSLDHMYVQQLAMVESWTLTDGQLALALKNGGSMFFRSG